MRHGWREAGRTELTGGVPAYNEERRIGDALRSLLTQELPPGTRWEKVWVAASGCTDRTAEKARTVDPRVHVLEDPVRRGKATALREIFAHAQGDRLVLLNADAIAAPGSVTALLEATRESAPPFAAMARPVPPDSPWTWTSRSLRLLWEVHHRFYLDGSPTEGATNLADELLLLPVSHLPPIPEGTVNDGAWIAGWLAREGGRVRYVPEARVLIKTPQRFRDHVRQRRRILWGYDELARGERILPGTLQRQFRAHPRQAIRVLRSATRSTPGGPASLAYLLGGEVCARALYWSDRWISPVDHVRWATTSG